MNGCIYRIKNKINKKIYIGQSINFEARVANHKWNANKKTNTPLYYAMNKYGIDNFEFSIIEDGISDLKILDKKERDYIKEYKSHTSENGYNVLNGNIKNPSGRRWRKGFTLTESHKKKISKAMTGSKNPRFGKPGTMKGKMGSKSSNWGNRGAKNQLSQNYIVHDTNNDKLFEITGISNFCRENNLNKGAMAKIARERKGIYKGYVIYEKEDYEKNGIRDYEKEKQEQSNNISQWSSKDYIIVTPDGNEIEVKNLISYFSKIFPGVKKTSLSSIYKIVNKDKSYKGYYIKRGEK